ncbi:MAG: DUF2799 domain-containing protein [Bacteriovoracaceae bacterium]|nr:DUF2799 domain-containing protein [Bacteriovoracaceae bacterium]
MKFILLFIGLSILISGCSSISKEECQTTDWFLKGQELGSLGKSSSRAKKNMKVCQEKGVSPNLAQFRKGYEEGLADHCSYDNGKILGESGKSSSLFCKGKLKSNYINGYRVGLKSFCSAENGRSDGEQGLGMNKLCHLSSGTGYRKGHFVGLRRFCSFENGLMDGKNGREAHSSCRAKVGRDYIRGHLVGAKAYQLQRLLLGNSRDNTAPANPADAYKQILNSKANSCISDFSCRDTDRCEENKCVKSGIKCNFRRDCEFEGRCVKDTCKY